MIIGVTGHREVKDERALYEALLKTFNDVKPEQVIVGMADGADLLAGAAAFAAGIPIVAVVPWRTHRSTIKKTGLYDMLLDSAKEVVYISDSQDFPGKKIYQDRNEYMVDHATNILAYFNGSPSGTGNCIRYANEKGVPVRNLYDKLN